MKYNILNRKIHYWATAAIAVPILVIIGSGLLLQIKKHSEWVQPPEQAGTGTHPVIGFESILSSVSSIESLGVDGWEDIDRMDVRPGRGIVKVWLHSGWEAQVDLGTGRVVQTAYRRSDIIESIHDGSFFGGDLVKLGVFLPAAITLFAMWVTGLWMFLLPFAMRRKRRRAASSTARKSLQTKS